VTLEEERTASSPHACHQWRQQCVAAVDSQPALIVVQQVTTEATDNRGLPQQYVSLSGLKSKSFSGRPFTSAGRYVQFGVVVLF